MIELTVPHHLAILRNLKSLHLPSTIKGTGDGGYSNDGSTYVFPTNLQNIYFKECTFLSYLGYYSFGYSSITSIDLSHCTALQIIKHAAFHVCSNLTSLDLSNCTALQTVDYSAFSYCSELTFVSLPPFLLTIEVKAFYECPKLIAVMIPASVQTIQANAFGNDAALQTVYWEAAQQPSGVSSTAFAGSPSVKHVYNYAP